MIVDIALFVLRLLLTAAICGFVWTTIKPTTRSMRILRAGILVVCLLVVLAAVRAASG
jgi:uncharacterized membrane protein